VETTKTKIPQATKIVLPCSTEIHEIINVRTLQLEC